MGGPIQVGTEMKRCMAFNRRLILNSRVVTESCNVKRDEIEIFLFLPSTIAPTSAPTPTPTSAPTPSATSVPTLAPTMLPTATPTAAPTPDPSAICSRQCAAGSGECRVFHVDKVVCNPPGDYSDNNGCQVDYTYCQEDDD